MKCQVRTKTLFSIVSTTIVLAFSANTFAAGEVDALAAKTLARKNSCFKCHASVTAHKKKQGPTWNEIANEYRDREDAEQRMITHLTTGEYAKFPDGVDEHHRIIKTKDPAQIKNLLNWILTF